MPDILFDNGKTATFAQDPTPEDLAEASAQLGGAKPTSKVAGVVDKLAGVGRGIANTVAESTGKAVGGLIAGGIGAGAQLYGQATGNKKAMEFGDKLEAIAEPNVTPGNILWSAVEMWPGGTAAKGTAKSLVRGAPNLLEKTVASPLVKGAEKKMVEALNPSGKEAKALADKVAPKLLEKGVIVRSADWLKEHAEKMTDKFGKEIGDKWAAVAPDFKINAVSVIHALANARDAYILKSGTQVRPAAVKAFDEVLDVIVKEGTEIPVDSYRKMKQIWGETKNFTKDEITAFKEKAERTAHDIMMAELNQNLPDIGKLNAEYSLWSKVLDVANSAKGKKVSHAAMHGAQALGAIGGAITGAVVGKSPGAAAAGTAIGGALFHVLQEAVSSPAWKSANAVLKSRLADYIIKGRVGDAIATVGKIMAYPTKSKEKE